MLRLVLRITALVLLGIALVIVLLVEGIYRHQLNQLPERPRRPTVTAPDTVLRALWAECEDGEFASQPLWAGTIAWRLGAAALRPRVRHSPGAANVVARDWLGAHYPRSYSYGLREPALAVWLSRHFTAAELAQARYDHAYFGRGAFGIEEAAASYFCKWPEELEMHEFATLVGFLQSPGRWHTFGVGRRSFMLREFVRQGLVSDAEATAAAGQSLEFASEPCWFVPDRPRMSFTAPSPDGGRSPVAPGVPPGR